MTKKEKIEYLTKYSDNIDTVPDEEIEQFKAIVEEGCKKDWVVALDIKGYCCYGGSRLYECDWYAAEKCFLKLVELTDNPFYYNTLGFIYYYGRCNDGIPQYEKAFQYFSVGAANGIYESMYKLSDMFLDGKGCLKSPKACAQILAKLYDENRELFAEGKYDCKFADIALRVGRLFEIGEGVEQNVMEAYSYYLEAKLAIEERTKRFNYYGDSSVKNTIDKAIETILPMLPMNFFTSHILLEKPDPIGDLLHHSVGIDICLDKVEGYYRLTAKGYSGEDAPGMALLTVAQLKYCKRTDELSIILDKNAKILYDVKELPYKAFVTSIEYDHTNHEWIFLYKDVELLRFRCKQFLFCGD